MNLSIRHKRTIALLIAAIFTFTAIMAMASTPTYAAAAKKPAKVAGITAKSTAYDSITVSWKKAKNAKKYEVYQATKKKGKYKKIATTTNLSYTKRSLTLGTSYYYKVRAINGKKKGAYSAIKTAKPTLKLSGTPVIDQENRTVTITAVVNRKYTSSALPISHLVLEKGHNDKSSPFITNVAPLTFYDALASLGAVPWSTSKKTFADGKTLNSVKGDNANFSHLEVTVDGRPLAGCLKYKKKGKEADPASVIDMAFSGNKANQKAWKTGCVSCIMSCYAGITSNASVGIGTVTKSDNYFYLDTNVLKGGQEVTIVYTLVD